MADLMEDVCDRIQGITEDLPRGSRIMVHVTERCGCKEYSGPAPRLSKHQGVACHVCNDRGYVLDAKTFFPRGEGDDDASE